MDTSSPAKEAEALYDEEDWIVVLGPCLSADPTTAEGLARILFELRQAINRGPDGVLLASNTLQAGLRQLYLYTEAHQAAFALFETYLQGRLKPVDEPVELLRGAIKRAQDNHVRKNPDEDNTPSDEHIGQ